MQSNVEFEERNLKLAEVATRLGVSERTVRRIIADGDLQQLHVRSCSVVPLSSLLAYEERLKAAAAKRQRGNVKGGNYDAVRIPTTAAA